MRPRTIGDFRGEFRPSGSQLNFRECPVCGSDEWKLYVNPETGYWFCQAGRHQGGGRVEVGAESRARAEGAAILSLLESARPAPPAATEVELPEFDDLSRSARRYLWGRGLTDDHIRRWGLVEWVDKGRVLIPYFDDSGNLIYWSSRLYSDRIGHGPKYLHMPGRHPLYVPDRLQGPERVVIVEGAFDAMAVRVHTPYQAIALNGKGLPRYLADDLRREVHAAILLKEGAEVVIALDGDAVGDALRLVQRWHPGRGIPYRVAVFQHGEDPASVEPGRLMEVIDGSE